MKYLLLVLFLFCCCSAYAQNLVPNPSFEEHSSCPNGINQNSPDEVAKATGWQSTLGTPDYFNACASFSSNVSVPNNQVGNQNAATGNAYCGLITYSGGGNYREVISTQLLASLLIGQKYYFSLKVSFAGYVNYYGVATDKLGAKFSTVQYSLFSPPSIDNAAQVYSRFIVSDTMNWILIKDSFVSDSLYRYINIGNFFDDAHTDITHLTQSGNNYYYIDDVCVSIDSVSCFSLNAIKNILPSTFAIYPNPANDIIVLQPASEINNGGVIVNLLGQTISNLKFISNNKLLIDCSQWTNGIYILRVNQLNYKIIIQHY